MSVAPWCCKSFCVVPCVTFCTGHFVMVPLNMTYLHCLQHSLFEHLFNLCFNFRMINIAVDWFKPTVAFYLVIKALICFRCFNKQKHYYFNVALPNQEIAFTTDISLWNWAVFFIVFVQNNWYHVLVKMLKWKLRMIFSHYQTLNW